MCRTGGRKWKHDCAGKYRTNDSQLDLSSQFTYPRRRQAKELAGAPRAACEQDVKPFSPDGHARPIGCQQCLTPEKEGALIHVQKAPDVTFPLGGRSAEVPARSIGLRILTARNTARVAGGFAVGVSEIAPIGKITAVPPLQVAFVIVFLSHWVCFNTQQGGTQQTDDQTRCRATRSPPEALAANHGVNCPEGTI